MLPETKFNLSYYFHDNNNRHCNAVIFSHKSQIKNKKSVFFYIIWREIW